MIMFCVMGTVAWAIIAPQGLRAVWATDQPACTSPGQPTANCTNAQEPWLTKDAAGFFTFLLVVVGGFQVVVFLWQLSLIRKSLEDAKLAAEAARDSAKTARQQADIARDTLVNMQDTARRQLRAYVNVEGAVRTKDPGSLEDGAEGFAVSVTVKNYGQTPAYDLIEWASVALRELPLEGRLPIHCLENPSLIVLPPGHKTWSFPAFRRNLSTIEENAIRANHTAIYVYGEVCYRDAFRKQHLTQFCLRCSGQGYDLGLFKADNQGNEAT